jgi:hypothetical protein
MKVFFRYLIVATLVLCPLSAAVADVAWTNWTSSGQDTVAGVLTFGSQTVAVDFNGSYYFAQLSGGTNYWNPSGPYLSATVPNAPPAADIIALSSAGTATITFSQAVVNPLIALVSWNGNTVEFGVPIEILSYGQGYWGNGTPILNDTGTGFYGSGEVHGVIRLPGSFTVITFTHTREGWHGFTVGAYDIAAAPLPASLLLVGSGLLALVGLRRFPRK